RSRPHDSIWHITLHARIARYQQGGVHWMRRLEEKNIMRWRERKSVCPGEESGRSQKLVPHLFRERFAFHLANERPAASSAPTGSDMSWIPVLDFQPERRARYLLYAEVHARPGRIAMS